MIMTSLQVIRNVLTKLQDLKKLVQGLREVKQGLGEVKQNLHFYSWVKVEIGASFGSSLYTAGSQLWKSTTLAT